jgi:phage terminase small subunit
VAKRKPSKRITDKAVQASEEKPFTLPTIEAKPEADEEPWGNDGLTGKQRMFVAAYIGPAAGNATKAAEMAGYKSDNRNSLYVTAHDTLRNPKVQEAIAHAFARQCDSPEWLRASILDMARVNMAHFAHADGNGWFTVDAQAAQDAAALGQIKEIHSKVLPGGEDTKAEIIEQRVKLHDRVACLTLAAKVMGMIVEKSETKLSGTINHEHRVQAAMSELAKDPEAFEAASQAAARLDALAKANGEHDRN